MKNLLTATLLLLVSISYSQYNYGLDIEQQDAKIEGRLNLDSGNDDLFIGRDTGGNSISGINMMIGHDVGNLHEIGNANVILGHRAASAGKNMSRNVLIGTSSGRASKALADNVYLGGGTGSCAGCQSVQERNIFLGASAGLPGNATNNIFIGYYAGLMLDRSDADNLLIIENRNLNDTNTKHLIYGEFDNRKVGINWPSGITNGNSTVPTLPATLSVNGTVHISETAKLEPQTSAPSTCSTTAEYGLMYYDRSVTPHKLKLCTDTGWNNLN